MAKAERNIHMNKRNRNRLLKEALSFLEQAYDLLLEAKDEECASFENWPESLQGTFAYELAEARAAATDDAAYSVEELRDAVEAIIADDLL